MKYRLLLIGLLLFSEAKRLEAQHPDIEMMTDKEYASYCIQNLKKGALIVRLNFKTRAVNALQQMGNAAEADRLTLEQRQENLAMMNAFKNGFKFCPVYFISMDSTIAFQKDEHGSYFLNEDLKVDSSIRMKEEFFLFAEYGMLETSLSADKTQPGQESVRRGLMADALILRDKNLKLLPDPFPFYVHFGDWPERVRKLEKKLQRFYLINK
ncbi:MAG: hypothetical protein H0V65_09405 [Chitinophagales bacterium]|nr:hypothetical protein [Chitinophagales bacterium]